MAFHCTLKKTLFAEIVTPLVMTYLPLAINTPLVDEYVYDLPLSQLFFTI